jgi:hypothetical protein
MENYSEDLYQQRAQILLKLLDNYLDKCNMPLVMDPLNVRELPLKIDKKVQEPIINFLRSTLQCKVSYGKDRFGQLNGYLLVSLDNDRLNQTGLYQGALALQKLNVAL